MSDLKDSTREAAKGSGKEEMRFCLGRIIVLLTVASVLGCHSGPPVAHLKGKVTIKGQPVPSEAHAKIMFAPPATGASRIAKAAIVPIVNGQYDAPNVPVGQIMVGFDIQKETGREFARGMKETINLVPEEHQSGMALTVSESDQTHDFDL
jgi:hypothetical protein